MSAVHVVAWLVVYAAAFERLLFGLVHPEGRPTQIVLAGIALALTTLALHLRLRVKLRERANDASRG